MLSFVGTILMWLLVPLWLFCALPLSFLFGAPEGAARREDFASALGVGAAALLPWLGAVVIFALAPHLDLAMLAIERSAIVWGLIFLPILLLMAFSGGPRLWTERLAPLAHSLVRTAGQVVMWLALIMALVQFSVVLLRYVFGVNFIWMQESITYMHGAVFLGAAGYALLTDDHVRVDVFYRDASPKLKARINLWGTYLLLFPVCFLIIWTAAPYVAASWEATEGSNEASGLQLLFLLKSLIPVFAVFLILAGFDLAYRSMKVLTGEPVHDDETHYKSGV